MAKGDTLERARSLISEGPPPSTGGAWNVHPDVDQVRQAVGKSFAGTEKVPGEPWFEWGCNHIVYPDQATKVEVTKFAMSYPLLEGVRKDGMLFCHQTKEESSDEAVVSVLAVLEYDSEKEKRKWFRGIRHKWNDFLTFAYVAKTDGVPDFFKKKKYKADVNRFMTKMTKAWLDHYIDWHHEFGPEGKHWYVQVFGVDPDSQGQGLGKQHMGRLNQLADELGMTQYLECGGSNRWFYEKMGYIVAKEIRCEDPTDENGEPMVGFLMTRYPKTVNQ